MTWSPAPDITSRIKFLIFHLQFKNISSHRIFSFRSQGSSSRATARIWSLPRIWQQALMVEPGYCLEVISERFDKLRPDDQEKVLIHELLHIPKSFSGSLVPHRSAHHRSFRHYHDTVNSLFNKLTLKSYQISS